MYAIIYDRASTKLQENNWSRLDAKDEGISIAKRHGYDYEYVKEIGSGTTLAGRPAMLKILDRIAAGEVQVLIVQELDRLARPTERAVYETIRNICLEYGVIIHTHNGTFDFADDDSDFVADINMAVAKKETRRIRKRMKRGRIAKAKKGGYIGGGPGLGYKVHYIENENTKPVSDLTINEDERAAVQAVFDTVEAMNGNIGGAAKSLNKQGYTGKNGLPFSAFPLKKLVTNRLYIGIVENALTEKTIYRPELQIITVSQFERVQKMIKQRSRKPYNQGGSGKYLFTGFVVCGNCNGPMVARNKNGDVSYFCANQNKYGRTVCKHSKSYSNKLLTESMIMFLSEFLTNHVSLTETLNNAVQQYGKTISEEVLEVAANGQLMAVKQEKERLIDAISKGILTHQEARHKLDALREEEQNLTVELASITEKAAIKEDYLKAIEALSKVDIKSELTTIAKEQPIIFRRLLGLIFEPNSLHVRSERVKGRKWQVVIEDYTFTEAIQEINSDLPHALAMNIKFWYNGGI